MSILDKELRECETFDEVSLWRAEKYKIDKRSGDNYKGILTNVYKEPTHFIYELLQNADDTKATNVKFVLSRDKIEFFHDGSKEFSLTDIISITGVGNSSKDASGTTSIGKFGVGFKAVFAVTDKPLIYSTTYNFQIENLSVPSEIQGRDLGDFTTIFQLDFKDENQSTLFRRNKDLLQSMSPETILFLKNICSVEIKIDDEQSFKVAVSRNEVEKSFGRVRYQKDDEETELLKFSNDGCSIVYQLINNVITPISGAKISVFFPTIVDSNLSFMVNAPFQTSTTRESIDFELPGNQLIASKFSDIFLRSIDKLKSLGLFTAELFNDVMPIKPIEESEDFPIYRLLHDIFLETIKTKQFIPTNHDKLLSASKVTVANDSDLVDLLKSIDSINFAHRNLSIASLQSIKQAGAHSFGPINLLELIDQGKIELNSYTDEWLYTFYEYCLQSILEDGWTRMFKRKIKQTPLIKTRTGGFVAAYFNDSPNVFRPSRGIPDHRIIHSMFLTDASAVSDETKSRLKNFLSELDITERKPVVVLKQDYFGDYTEKTNDEKIEIFKSAANIYHQSEPREKADIEVYLKNIAFIPSESGVFRAASVLYNSYSSDLKYLLGANHPELFCATFIGDRADYRDFCLKLGLINSLEVKEISTHHTSREDFIELYESVGSSQDYGVSTKEYTQTDYRSPLLSIVLSDTISNETTSRLAPLLLAIQPSQLIASFKWQHYGTKEESIGPSSLSKLLTDTPWIAYDDQLVIPAEMPFDDFCNRYKLPRNNVLQNLTWSNDDIIKQLSEKEQEAIKIMRELDLSPEEMHELRRVTLEKRKKTERLGKRISTDIEESHGYEEQAEELADIASESTADTRSQGSNQTVEPESTSIATHLAASEAYEAADTHSDTTVTSRVAAESSHSNVELEEREVLKGLVDWYAGDGYTPEQQDDDKAAYRLQKNGSTLKVMLMPKNQSGYNIEISENDKIIKTVAVIKADLEKKRFTISESQWNLSKRDDIQHSIYLVSRQGSSMSQIVIDDLRERVRNGSVRAVPGVIYYE